MVRPNIKPTNLNSVFVTIVTFLSPTMQHIVPSKLKFLSFYRGKKKKKNVHFGSLEEVDPFPKEVSYRKQRRNLFMS